MECLVEAHMGEWQGRSFSDQREYGETSETSQALGVGQHVVVLVRSSIVSLQDMVTGPPQERGFTPGYLDRSVNDLATTLMLVFLLGGLFRLVALFVCNLSAWHVYFFLCGRT